MSFLIVARPIDDTPLQRPHEGEAPWRPSTWVSETGCRPSTGAPSSGSSTTARRPAPDAHNARTTWLTTLNEDGSAHVTAVGAVWLDGTFWFQTGSGTRKSRNVARDPRCTIALSIRDADVVFEGDAARVTDARQRGARRQGVGGQRLAGGTRSERVRHHRTVQRTVAGTAAVERVSHRAPLCDRGAGHGAGRSDALQVLSRARPVGDAKAANTSSKRPGSQRLADQRVHVGRVGPEPPSDRQR